MDFRGHLPGSAEQPTRSSPFALTLLLPLTPTLSHLSQRSGPRAQSLHLCPTHRPDLHSQEKKLLPEKLLTSARSILQGLGVL